MNKFICTGHIANDPEAYTTQNGVSRSTFRIAVQRDHKNANGEREADFLTVVAWRQTADFCNKYLKKGNRIAVVGSIQNRSYDAQDGSKRWVTEIIASSIEALERLNIDQAGSRREVTREEFVAVDSGEELPF